MKLDLTALLNKRMPKADFDFTVDPSSVEGAAGFAEDIALTGDIRVCGSITDNNGYMALEATVSADYKTVCDRCLKGLTGHIEFPFGRIVRVSASEDGGEDEDELLYVSEGVIDFDRDVIEELSLELPIYHLCSEDCPGLCPVCGKRLDGSCVCEKTKETDPRMETFRKLLDKMKE